MTGTGQTPITRATRVAAGALGVPAQLLADADAATGALPGAADLVATAARRGTTPTALLERVLEEACPPGPARAGADHTHQHGAAGAAPHRLTEEGIVITDRKGHEFYELNDLELLWGPTVARETWKRVVLGTPTHYGIDARGRRVTAPSGQTLGWEDLIPAEQWPDVLRAAVAVADSLEGRS